jgi:hypothetical protein
MAALEALPQTVRIGRDKPLGAATPQQLREIGQLLERAQIVDATTLAVPSGLPSGPARVRNGSGRGSRGNCGCGRATAASPG